MTSRARFLTGIGGIGACALVPLTGDAQSGNAARRIDVHRHISPPFYQDSIRGKYTRPFPPPLASWTPERCLADMDAAGIETGILSMPARPGMYFGDAAFAPVWSEVDRRNGIVFTHPTDAPCCPNPVPQMSETVVEFGADTTRTIGSLVFSGASTKYPNIRFIFSHGGGTMPFVIDRFLDQGREPKSAALLPHGVEYELRRFFYDTAFASSPSAMAALLKLVPPSQVVIGTDFPYKPGPATIAELDKCGVPARQLAAIGRQSAVTLLARS